MSLLNRSGRGGGYDSLPDNRKGRGFSSYSWSSVIFGLLVFLLIGAVFVMVVVLVANQNTVYDRFSKLSAEHALLLQSISNTNVTLATQVGETEIATEKGQSGIRQILNNPCSRYKAFGTPGTEQGYLPGLNVSLKQTVDHAINKIKLGTGYFAFGLAGDDTFAYTAGIADPLITNRPWQNDTIFRLASESKFIGAMGFFKYMSQHFINGATELRSIIPEYGNTKVIVPYTPIAVILALANPLSTTSASTTVTLVTPSPHGFTTGDLVKVSGAGYPTPVFNLSWPFVNLAPSAVSGIPAADLNKVQTITVINSTAFSFVVATAASTTASSVGGLNVEVAKVDAVTVKATAGYYCNPRILYYKEAALERHITLGHVLEHSLGWVYGATTATFCGINPSPSIPNYQATLIHTQLQNEFPRIGVGAFDIPGTPVSGVNIKTWAQLRAAIPLIYQPGTGFSYGPQISVLGAVMETVDASPTLSQDPIPQARSLERIMKDVLFDPLGLTDTLFFIQDSDPLRANRLARMSTINLAFTSFPIRFVFPPFRFLEEYAYGSDSPRGTAFLDGGLLSTVNDRIKIMRFLKDGGRLPNGIQYLPATLLAQATAPRNLRYQRGALGQPFDLDDVASWGLGVSISTHDDPLYSSTTGNMVGTRVIDWGGFFNTAYAVDFGNDHAIAYGTNTLGISTFQTIIASRFSEYLKCIDTHESSSLNQK